MAKYKLRKHSIYDSSGNVSSVYEDILDTETKTAIPKTTDNVDYNNYLDWVAEGNTPDPAD
tara:strand:+ start:537 stop:719 length:183 start_codon:yes stop_codon:yes gene_type:complete